VTMESKNWEGVEEVFVFEVVVASYVYDDVVFDEVVTDVEGFFFGNIIFFFVTTLQPQHQ